MRRCFCFTFAFVLVLTPASAATVTTQQFIATIEPLIHYLDASSRLASANAADAGVRAFARAETNEAAAMLAAIETWHRTDVRQAAEDAAAPTIDGLGPVANAVNATVDAAAAANRVLTSPLAPLVSKRDLEGFARQDLERLATLAGPDVDAFYLASDAAALRRLVEELKSYILNGDDTTLRRFAVGNLARAKGWLAALGHIRR